MKAAKKAARSRGRQTISKDGERMKTRAIRATDAEWAKFLRMGGGPRFREWVRRAKD